MKHSISSFMSCVFYKRPSSVHSITLDNAWNSKLKKCVFFLWGMGVACIWGLIHKFSGELLNILWNNKVKPSWWWAGVWHSSKPPHYFHIYFGKSWFLITIFKKKSWQRNNFGNCSCDWSQSTYSNFQCFLHRTYSLKSAELIEQKYTTSRN